jgi:hypothetical protein
VTPPEGKDCSSRSRPQPASISALWKADGSQRAEARPQCAKSPPSQEYCTSRGKAWLNPGREPRVHGRGGIGQASKRKAGIGADGGFEPAIEAQFLAVNIDLDESGIRRKQARPANRQAVICVCQR